MTKRNGDHVPEVDPWKLLDEAQAVQRTAEAAIRRARQYLLKAIEVKMLPDKYHSRRVIADLTAALVAMGTEEAR